MPIFYSEFNEYPSIINEENEEARRRAMAEGNPNVEVVRVLYKFRLLPLRSTVKVSGLYAGDIEAPEDGYDPVDEILMSFRANVFSRTFEFKRAADYLLAYGTLFVSLCLNTVKRAIDDNGNLSKEKCKSCLARVTSERNFFTPPPADSAGGSYWPLPVWEGPYPPEEQAKVHDYLLKVRNELAYRLLDRLYPDGNETAPTKWWMGYSARKFLDRELRDP